MKQFTKKFILCGLTGWGFECFFTGCKGIIKHKKTLPCTTSLWMFGIYGMGYLIEPIYKCIKNLPQIIRGFIYTTLIFTTEYISGTILKEHKACPWDYSKAKYNFKGVIRLDYAPLWFIVGLIYEKILITLNKSESFV